MTAGEFTHAHPALSGFWHPVALSSEVGPDPIAVRLAGLGWALAEFPLDVAAELHTRADRVSVEFRRVLAAAVAA
jgi:hypothetical protein